MNKLDFFILWLHYLTGNEEWMLENKLTEASSYYGSYDNLKESLTDNASNFNLTADKAYFYNHLNLNEDTLISLETYEIEYDSNFSRGLHLVNVDLGFGDDVRILKRDNQDVYYVKFNPKKLHSESVILTRNHTSEEVHSKVNDNDTTEKNNNESNSTPNSNRDNRGVSSSVKINTVKDVTLSVAIYLIANALKISITK